MPAPSPAAPSWRRFVVLALLTGLVGAGACHLAFLCDDAFITFRYVSNAMHGHGLVWNPPPFAPVEGYTGFSWALVLWFSWSWFGVEPPAAANVLSIACGLATFVLVARAALRLTDRDGRRLAFGAVCVTLLTIASNRTFLQWMSSGLETSLFVLVTVAWVLRAYRGPRGVGWLAGWSGLAAASALTRPDGLLLVLATLATGALLTLQRRLSWRGCLAGLAPLLLVAAHLGWRRAFYGDWLPNTYFAKVGEPWPEAGQRYLLLFLVENGGLVVAVVLAGWLGHELRRGGRALAPRLLANAPATAAVVTMLATLGYYVFIVGGDHFEFRILSHLVPLGGLAVAAMAARLWAGRVAPLLASAALGLLALVAWVIPAVQPPTTFLYQPLWPHVPDVLQPLARWYDGHRAWLTMQAVNIRCDQHRLFLEGERLRLPPRTRSGANADDVPVLAADCVGWLGWVLPDVHIVDRLGLNDRVAARWSTRSTVSEPLPTPFERAFAKADQDGDGRVTAAELAAASPPGADAAAAGLLLPMLALVFGDADGTLPLAAGPQLRRFFAGLRRMAHDRQAPAEYVMALAPNVTLLGPRVEVTPRSVPLSAARVREIEQQWFARALARRRGE